MSSTAAELGAAAEAVEGYRRRVGNVAAGLAEGRDDDLITVVVEAERALGVAVRSIRRALKVAGRR